MVDNDLYIFLESDRSACDDVLTKNYRRLARSFHPDKNPGSGEKFKEISNAYRILSDPIRRRMYDCYGVEYLKQPHMFREEEEEFRGMQPANDDIEVLELSSDSSENESESENQVRNERRGGTKRKNQAGRKPLSVKIDENENRMTPKEVERIAHPFNLAEDTDVSQTSDSDLSEVPRYSDSTMSTSSDINMGDPDADSDDEFAIKHAAQSAEIESDTDGLYETLAFEKLCSSCMTMFYSEALYHIHAPCVHKDERIEKIPVGTFGEPRLRCKNCSKAYRTVHELRRHYQTHCKRTYTCTSCTFAAHNLWDMKRHLSAHIGQ
ncbi:DnaJ -like protein subfamily A member 2 [Halotydeus destructor]|nr:DnaJ -like protein subfamily A member 2 [Halotydeus destructor]